MSVKPGLRGVVALALIAPIAISGCSMFQKKKPTLAYEERPVELLYNTGANELDKHRWNDAVNYFREVERQHPYSEWARRAILMTAYAHYEANDYAEAISEANRFIALYPGNAATPYAYYLKAVCYFEQIVDVGRDQASTEQARVALSEVMKRYPNTQYSVDSKLKYDMVQDQLAGKEMTIGRYYLRNGNPIAAIGRFKDVVDKYQTTTHAPEALYRLVEAYLTVGLVREAKENGAVLGYNYPGDYWYEQAYKLLTSRGERPSLEPAPIELPHLPFTHKTPSRDIVPPPVDVAEQRDAAPPEAVGTSVAAQPTTPPKQKPKKDFVHGVLGL
ncbi:MAG: outer membrane protein assembly factor BamD [Hyphomicrobiales bacterium]|nr:outer membrane protein assembly factor BamD [Hyphomicrobiales bacterium]